MKLIKALSILALIAGFTAPALAEPAPAKPAQERIMAGPGDGAAGPLNMQENNSTYQQIQSPRDPASGQATGAVQPSSTNQMINGQSGGNLESASAPKPGAQGWATCSGGACETARSSQIANSADAGVEDGSRRRPPRNKSRKGRRMHKP